jgi:hypothetical protein
VLDKAQALMAEAPVRERRWVLLATAQYQSGRQSEALGTLRRLRAVMDRELDLDPSPDIDALEQAILRKDLSLVAASALPEPSPVCPYPGLKPYDIDGADGFFGRYTDVSACLHKLTDISPSSVGHGQRTVGQVFVDADGSERVVYTVGGKDYEVPGAEVGDSQPRLPGQVVH